MTDIPRPLKIAIFATAVVVLTVQLASPIFTSFSPERSHLKMNIPLKISISDITTNSAGTTSPSVNLKVTIHNTSPDKPVSFLRWSTPLDARASAMGIFIFKSKSTGTAAKSLDLKLNRKIPEDGIFPHDDVVRIEAAGSVETNVEVKPPEVLLESGETYIVSARGSWMHVAVGDYSELRTADEGVLRGDFESAEVEVQT